MKYFKTLLFYSAIYAGAFFTDAYYYPHQSLFQHKVIAYLALIIILISRVLDKIENNTKIKGNGSN